MTAYISRSQAVALARAAEPGVEIHDEHVFNGDIFEKHLELIEPRPGGTFNPVLAEAIIVVSHSCEYTKAARRPAPSDYPILVAPLRPLAAFDGGMHQQFRDGKIVAAPYLPSESPVDVEYVADLKLIQPVAAADLIEAPHLCCLEPAHRLAFQGRVAVFLFRDRILS